MSAAGISDCIYIGAQQNEAQIGDSHDFCDAHVDKFYTQNHSAQGNIDGDRGKSSISPFFEYPDWDDV